MQTPPTDTALPRRPSWKVLLLHLLCVIGPGALVVPFAVSFLTVVKVGPPILLPAALIGGVMGWWPASRRVLPVGFAQRYLLPLALFLPALFFGFLPLLFALGFSDLDAAKYLAHVYITAYLGAFALRERRRPDRVVFPRPVGILFTCLLLVPAGHLAFLEYDNYLYGKQRGHGFEYVGGYADVDLLPYDPRNPQNILPRLEAPATFQLSDPTEMPVLDGAQAAFPVYGAFALACYAGLPPLSAEEMESYNRSAKTSGPVTFTNTREGYLRLIDGKTDIFFGAEPSQEQREEASRQGKEFVLTPIGREAFVFFVNDRNPVDGLTSSQLRDIYSGNVVDWKEVGGEDEPVIAFQRPEGSGSQTVMLRFMGDTPLAEPLKNRFTGGMGAMLERVSEYRNAPSALGYSFRYFTVGMNRKPRIKLLTVDGIAPTPENIRLGIYPYTVNLYAVTIKGNPKTAVAPFLEWMRGPQGQVLVERIGYSRIETMPSLDDCCEDAPAETAPNFDGGE